MTSPSAPKAAAPEGSKQPRRQRSAIHRESSDASRFHMSKAAVDRSVDEFATWTDLKCIRHLAEIRWGSYTLVT